MNKAKPKRVCIVYDCLFPWTIGGAERWYRNLAERLAAAGNQITYLTLCQWDGEAPALPGVEIIAVGPRLDLYHDGKRRIWPPLRFGIGVFLHLLRHGGRYDRVHTASFPFFSLLAAAALRWRGRYQISVDWHEVWSEDYWRAYLGRTGAIGILVQRLCAKVPQRGYSFSRMHLDRLKALGVNGSATLLPGEYAGGPIMREPPARPPHIVYAGRLIPEKRIPLLVEALAIAMRGRPNLHATIFGGGPDLPAITQQIAALGLGARIALPGFVDESVVDQAMRRATAIVQPSAREGYGMVVVEASARGVPAVVVAADDNAAIELVQNGINGFAVMLATADALAEGLIACIDGGNRLRASTHAWYLANAARLSIGHSIDLLMTDLS